MGAVLVAMSIGGVFNTVLLETRQRAREMAVLKAIGLTPAQVVTTVIATIVPVGLVAGAIGVPIGLIAQHVVLDYMGQVAAKTRVPGEVFDVFPPMLLLGLGLLGLVIGALGAFVPAQRAARSRIAPILQAE
jgi:putative ABC transport system permease protein